MRIVIAGAGAIGGYIGAKLARAGAEKVGAHKTNGSNDTNDTNDLRG